MRRWPTNLGLMVLGAVLIRIVTGREWCAPIRSKEPPQSGDGPTRGMLVLWRWRLCSRAEQRTQARGSLAHSLARVPADLVLSWRRTLDLGAGPRHPRPAGAPHAPHAPGPHPHHGQ